MMLLFLDTETSDLIKGGLPLDDASQPHLAQLALVLTDDEGKRVSTFCAPVHPYTWKMSPAATAVNGLSDEYLHERGLPLVDVLHVYRCFSSLASRIVAHQAAFDRKMLDIELSRLQLPLSSNEWFCTKLATTNILKLPPAPRRTTHKWPTLDEAHHYYFGVGVAGAHDALVDAEACMRVYFALKRQHPEVVEMTQNPDDKMGKVLQEALDSAGSHVADMGKAALDAVEGILKQANEAMPNEEGLKDIARGLGVDFGGEKKPDGE
jgi:DNA polymerase-3 subunit epsilon